MIQAYVKLTKKKKKLVNREGDKRKQDLMQEIVD